MRYNPCAAGKSYEALAVKLKGQVAEGPELIEQAMMRVAGGLRGRQ